jgi:hypothetical protein
MTGGRLPFSAVSDKSKFKKKLLESKDGERGWGSCFFCEESFDESQLVVLEKVPAALGGEYYPDNFFLSCKNCSSRKLEVDKVVVKLFQDMGLVEGKKFMCHNNIGMSLLHEYYFESFLVVSELKGQNKGGTN